MPYMYVCYVGIPNKLVFTLMHSKTHLKTSIQKLACITYKILHFMHKSTQVGMHYAGKMCDS